MAVLGTPVEAHAGHATGHATAKQGETITMARFRRYDRGGGGQDAKSSTALRNKYQSILVPV